MGAVVAQSSKDFIVASFTKSKDGRFLGGLMVNYIDTDKIAREAVRAVNKRNKSRLINCAMCGKEILIRNNKTKYCRECAEKTPFLKTRFQVLVRDEFRCIYCGRNPIEHKAKLVIDHLIPLAEDGKTNLSNLVTACEECNQGKKDILLEKHTIKLIKKRIEGKYGGLL